MTVAIDHPDASLQAACEQLLLVEHHCVGRWSPEHPVGRWCARCVRKHAHTAAALVDEAVALSGHGTVYVRMQPFTRWVADLADAGAPKETICYAARSVRRQFMR